VSKIGDRSKRLLRNFDPMGVRAFLALLVGAGAQHLGCGGVFAEFAVGRIGNRLVAGSVVGDEKKFAGFCREREKQDLASSRSFCLRCVRLGWICVKEEALEWLLLLAEFVSGVGHLPFGWMTTRGVRRFDGRTTGVSFPLARQIRMA